MEFLLLGGGLLIIIFAVVIAVVSSVVSQWQQSRMMNPGRWQILPPADENDKKSNDVLFR